MATNKERTFVDEIEDYFKNTPKEQIQKDWDETAEFDKVGPTVSEFIEKPKQETLEEAADSDSKNHYKDQSDYWAIGFDSFKRGAKWQVKRMYSDIELFTEELKDKIDSFEYSVNQNSYISDYIKEWFEQFKKK